MSPSDPPDPQVSASATACVRRGRWNSYAVGVGLGVLSWVAFGLVNQPLRISTALSAVSGACAVPVMGVEGVTQNAYWARTPFRWDGGMLFLVGTMLGSLERPHGVLRDEWLRTPDPGEST